MKLLIESPYGVIENFQEVGSVNEIVYFLNCFVNDNQKLLFAFSGDLNSIDSAIHKKLVFDRTAYINNEWVLPWDPPKKRLPSTHWICPIGKEEVIEAIKMNQLFLCVIVDKQGTFQEYSYVLRHIEEDTSFSLCFTEKREGDFQRNVLPKIKQFLK
jgi:hypothetical protein